MKSLTINLGKNNLSMDTSVLVTDVGDDSCHHDIDGGTNI